MAGSRTGTPSIVDAARKICRMVGTYGAADLSAKTTPAFAAAVATLVAACAVLQALDDNLLKIDRHEPLGPEDIPPA